MDQTVSSINVPKRILNTLIHALSAGVVPRNGAAYIAIGRQEEIAAVLKDCDTIADSGAACRFLIGRYGSGKSFLIQLIRTYALERDFLTVDADLSPERRLSGGNGCSLATYRELLKNMASKASPDGGALATVLSRYYAKIETELADCGILPEHASFASEMKKRVIATVSCLEGDVGGFDFSHVISEYYAASIDDNQQKKSACLRWLRGEFSTKTEAKAELGFSVSTVICDENWYHFLKLFALFAKEIGYRGLLVFIDECVNLYKIPNRISRESNYEKILAVFNDVLQGKANHIGFFFGGTPQFLEDNRRGLFSYEALKSRLEDSKYAALGYQNLSSPVIRLRRLSGNELLALVRRLNKLFMQKEGLTESLLTDEQTEVFMKFELDRAGAAEMVTPREIIRDFLTMLQILKDNENASFSDFMLHMKAESAVQTEPQPANKEKKIGIFDIEL